MKNFVEYIIKALVEHPESISVAEIQGRRSIVLEIRCHSEDMGRIIGRNGKTIGAIRALLSSIATRHGRKTILEVVE